MSEMLGFDLDDQDECDITTEDDLIFLGDPTCEMDLEVRASFVSCEGILMWNRRFSEGSLRIL